MSSKKKVIILCLALLLIVVITVLIMSLFANRANNNSNNDVDNSEAINNNGEIPANGQVDISTSEDIENIGSDDNIDDNQNIQQEETNSNQPIVEEQEEVTNNDDNTQEQERPINENVSEENQNETEKAVCSNNDAEFSSFIARYKQENPTFYIVDSLEEAKEFGENAMTKYGYAYEYNSIPEMFEGTNCIKEIWYVRLTVPQQECTINGVYNDTMYLLANDIANITNIFDYLRNKGYDCGTKQWYY